MSNPSIPLTSPDDFAAVSYRRTYNLQVGRHGPRRRNTLFVGIDSWKTRARHLKTEVHALYLAYRDPRVPWYGRLLAACVLAYAFSPLDLIPDPIPVLGYLDDLILIPLGVALALRLIPPQVMADARTQAQSATRASKPTNWVAAGVIVAIWIVLAALAIRVLVNLVR